MIAACIGLVALVAYQRDRRVARRPGMVVAVLAVLIAIATPIPAVGGMPPIAPCLLAFILGIAKIRREAPREIGMAQS